MTQQVIAALRAAVHQAVAVLGETKAKEIIAACLQQYSDDHYGR